MNPMPLAGATLFAQLAASEAHKTALCDNGLDCVNAATQIEGLVLTLWTVYLGIIAAVLALITSGRPIVEKPWFRKFAIAGYLIGAEFNLWAILNLRSQHDWIVAGMDKSLWQLSSYMSRPPEWAYIVAHVLFDTAVCVAIWLIPARIVNTRP